jgi:hypothetical protein
LSLFDDRKLWNPFSLTPAVQSLCRSQLTVVISQAQGRNPSKRRLEEDIAAALIGEPGISVTLVPHLYDMAPNHSGLQLLREVRGPLLVMGWLYERAIRWTLDRAGVRGHEGVTLLKAAEDADDDEDSDEDSAEQRAAGGIGSLEIPDRSGAWICEFLRVPQSLSARFGAYETS